MYKFDKHFFFVLNIIGANGSWRSPILLNKVNQTLIGSERLIKTNEIDGVGFSKIDKM